LSNFVFFLKRAPKIELASGPTKTGSALASLTFLLGQNYVNLSHVMLIWGLRGIFKKLIMVPKIMQSAMNIYDIVYSSLMHVAGDRNILFMRLTLVILVKTGIKNQMKI
jgi:hypothetical protein